jgi:hypothetical protein
MTENKQKIVHAEPGSKLYLRFARGGLVVVCRNASRG